MFPPPPPKIFRNKTFLKLLELSLSCEVNLAKLLVATQYRFQIHPSKLLSAQTIKIFFLQNTTPHNLSFFLFPMKLIPY